MSWSERGDDGTRRWEREDGTATLTLRQTANERWAVTLDVIKQAADGPVYRRATLTGEDAAVEQAERWYGEFTRTDS